MGSNDGSTVTDDATVYSGTTTAAPPRPGHNSSAQHDVYVNPDPALDISNEHHHAHVHHGQTAIPDEKDDIVFAKSSDKYTGDHGVPAAAAPDYKVRQMSSNEDEESGRVGDIDNESKAAKKWSFKWVYRKYKLVFHLAIWAVWTA